MAISISQIERDLVTYADFEETDSASRAKKFVTAAKRWLIMRPTEASRDGNSMSMSHAQVQSLLMRAQEFVQVKDTSSSGAARVRFLSVERNFR